MINAALLDLAESRKLPDQVIRFGMRRLIQERLDELRLDSSERQEDRKWQFVESMRSGPIAVHTEDANEQHYELPAGFFEKALGRHLKYSSCYWTESCRDLTEAEAKMLDLVIERADLQEGQSVLELGCGWGSLCLEVAKRFPGSRLTAVSNSRPQREFIEQRASRLGLSNLTVLTQDMNTFESEQKFDRVVSVEMFEHMRNQEKLLRRIRSWLADEGRLFIHVFCHREFPYLFETEGESNWMGRFFFTGGMMPSFDLLPRYDSGLSLERSWVVEGHHYAKTARAWLKNIDQKDSEVLPIFGETYGREKASIWFQRWRMFFMACEELFGFQKGQEWWVGHYRFKKGANL